MIKIGIDIDDTICKTWQHVIPYMAKYFNVLESDLKNSDKMHKKALNVSDDEYYAFALKFYGDILKDVPLIENAVSSINNLKNSGFQIIFITARSENGFTNPYKTSYDYLVKSGINFDKLIIGAKEKGKICKNENIDLFIDDSVKNCLDVSNQNIDVILFPSIENKSETRFLKLSNWLEIEKYIKERYNG